jgi:23S rRNA (cytosine1962-C5)-methyltransferase
MWQPAMDESIWKNAHGRFIATGEESGGHWDLRTNVPNTWVMNYGGLSFFARPSNSRHLGIFPEQANHWNWICEQVNRERRELNVLNLFGYTGIATLAAAKVGARVTHVDASKKAIIQARENQKISHLDDAPIRWIVDDALKFVRREVRREARYDGIILDPPKFGRGPKGEVWEFFDMLPVLLKEISPLISEHLRFLVITAYAIRSSSLALYYSVGGMVKDLPGNTTAGELVVQEKSAGRQISLAIWARWSARAGPG